MCSIVIEGSRSPLETLLARTIVLCWSPLARRTAFLQRPCEQVYSQRSPHRQCWVDDFASDFLRPSKGRFSCGGLGTRRAASVVVAHTSIPSWDCHTRIFALT